MIARLSSAVRRHPFLCTGFALALAVTVFFAARTVLFALYWADPAHRDQPIAGWMTPRYVAHSWDVPPEVIAAALGDAARPGERMTLAQIAARQGIAPEALAQRMLRAVEAHRAATE